MTSRRFETDRRLRRAGVLGVLALTVAAAIAYVAYDALNGLPFQSRYRVTIVLPDAKRLISAADVKIGGVRVGQVSRIDAAPATAHAPVSARIVLSLDPSVGPLPVDSTIRVNSASPLGATYVDLTPGASRTSIPDGGTLPPASSREQPEFVDLFDIFDRSTRQHFQQAVGGLSGGLAGRGSALNTTIESLSALLPPFTAVAGALAAPPARLGRFIRTYATTFDALASVSPQLAGLVSGAATTFDALAGEREALGSTIDLAPGTEESATGALRAVRPGLDRLARLTVALRPATRRLPAALRELDATITTGAPVLRTTGRLTTPLVTSLDSITTAAREPSTDGAIRKLSETFGVSNDILAALLPAQTQCNLIPLFFQQMASWVGVLGVGNGPSLIQLIVDRRAAQGEQLQSAAPAPDLHINYLPNENHNECEAGNEPYDATGRVLTNPAGLQPASTRESTPPPHVLDLARSVGLLAPGGSGR